AWQSGTLDQPPSLVALIAGAWPLLAGMVMLRYLPLLAFGGAGPQAPRIAAYTLAAAAVAGPLLSLLTVDVRRALLLASSGRPPREAAPWPGSPLREGWSRSPSPASASCSWSGSASWRGAGRSSRPGSGRRRPPWAAPG